MDEKCASNPVCKETCWAPPGPLPGTRTPKRGARRRGAPMMEGTLEGKEREREREEEGMHEAALH